MVKILRFFLILYTTFLALYITYLFTISSFTKTRNYTLSIDEPYASNTSKKLSLDILGKASIGDYFWHHIFDGQVVTLNNTLMKSGALEFGDVHFMYRTGPGYIQTTIPQDMEHLVLILNGRTVEKVKKAKEWLDYLPKLPGLRKACVVLLGNEQCENEWILRYMRSRGGLIDLLFLTYDSPLVDDVEIFQWPLGVAVYRGFPRLEPSSMKTAEPRPYKCNFIGTVYQNTTREIVADILKNIKDKHECFLSTRSEWVPKESTKSLNMYKSVLMNSDLTLNPVGKNAECYRIYEAMSLGSIPVVEDVMTPGICSSPLRLLKKYNAPIIYIKNWNNLEKILATEKHLSLHKKIHRREAVLKWYKDFKNYLKQHFVKVIKNTFFM